VCFTVDKDCVFASVASVSTNTLASTRTRMLCAGRHGRAVTVQVSEPKGERIVKNVAQLVKPHRGQWSKPTTAQTGCTAPLSYQHGSTYKKEKVISLPPNARCSTQGCSLTGDLSSPRCPLPSHSAVLSKLQRRGCFVVVLIYYCQESFCCF
jgi:hypothetical protein